MAPVACVSGTTSARARSRAVTGRAPSPTQPHENVLRGWMLRRAGRQEAGGSGKHGGARPEEVWRHDAAWRGQCRDDSTTSSSSNITEHTLDAYRLAVNAHSLRSPTDAAETYESLVLQLPQHESHRLIKPCAGHRPSNEIASTASIAIDWPGDRPRAHPQAARARLRAGAPTGLAPDLALRQLPDGRAPPRRRHPGRDAEIHRARS